MAKDEHWREKELNLEEVKQKYPDVSSFMILKVDIQRRGIVCTEKALELFDPKLHSSADTNESTYLIDGRIKKSPVGLTLRDGTFIPLFYNFTSEKAQREAYVVDAIDGRLVVTDNKKVIDRVSYWERPDFYDKFTSKGIPMSSLVSTRPQRLDVTVSDYCHFWDKSGEGCKYCPITPQFRELQRKSDKPIVERNDVEGVRETIREALKQKGRYSSVLLSSGSILSGKEIFDDEVDGYIELLQAIGDSFESKKFPSQIVASAFNEKQLVRLYEETGLMSYTTDLEVLNKEKFEWICSGKANHVGYEEWKRRLYAAVDIFGKGNVSTGFVAGVELASPNGFDSEEEALKVILEEAEIIGEHGVSFAANVWRASPHSIFANQNTPSLEYYVRLFEKLDKICRKNGVGRYTDDYRRCGQHPGNDLMRI